MDRGETAFRGRILLVGGLLASALTGALTFAVAGAAISQQDAASAEVLLDATHVPLLLTTPEEPAELSYDVSCVDRAVEDQAASCAVKGSVFIRSGVTGRFRELELSNEGASTGRLVARVPEAIASSRAGFSYYAVIDESSGPATVTVPAGGASAPDLSLPLGEAVDVDLGVHHFGELTRPDERVSEAVWGDGAYDVGLEQGRNLTPIGASAFDVDESGGVVLLDQANRRVLRWRHGSKLPTRVPIAIDGTLADVTLAPDGSLYVLESASRPGRKPLVRHFDPYGRQLASIETAERTSSQIRLGPTGPLVLEQPSEQWMPVAAGGSPVGPENQRRLARSGRSLRAGGEVTILRRDNEIRVALTGANGVRRSWRVRSDTPLAEVQLAEPLGKHVLVIVRVFSETKDEFVALVLGDNGLVRQLSLDSAAWAETAPLGRFRLVGHSLYRLGSTASAAFVDRFDLEVH
jgi:hypothetical protein